MCKRVYLTAKEAEREMQESRNVDGFTGKMETDYISRMIKDAKRNSMVGDKLQLVVDPMYIHIPEWQRRLSLARAYVIGNSYNKYKWDVPKVLFHKGKLWVIDGQHRIYGAFKAKMDSVVVEIMECSIEEAIELFINQSQDRRKMQPNPSIKMCLRNHERVKAVMIYRDRHPGIGLKEAKDAVEMIEAKMKVRKII